MKIGSLFSGYGGADLAVQSVFPDAHPVWFVEYDKHPSAVLAKHWPNVPNYGDVTAVDWAAVEPVDILTGGFPCQDLSHAGKRAGLRPGTRSGLWEHMAYAISQLRPPLVVIENVRGLLSAEAHSDLERDCWCVGDDREPALRALGAVLGDLAGLGYDARWTSVRAADAGAPHGRFRVFVVAYPHCECCDGAGPCRTRRGGNLQTVIAENADRPTSGERRQSTPGQAAGRGPRADAGGSGRVDDPMTLLPTPTLGGHDVSPERAAERDVERGGLSLSERVSLLPTPKASDGPHGGPGMRNGRGEADALPGVVHHLLPTPEASTSGSDPEQHLARKPGRTKVTALNIVAEYELLPTPAVNDMGAGKTPPQWDEWTERMRAEHGNGNGHGKSLEIEAQRLLPTATAMDSVSSSGSNPDWGHGVTLTDAAREVALLGTVTAHPDNIRSPEQARSTAPTPSEVMNSGCDFGPYSAAVARWEQVLGRPAPSPTEPGRDGRPRLSPRFVEWMMGLPDGWVTDTGIPRNAQLKALGNGIVPQQAALALRLLLDDGWPA